MWAIVIGLTVFFLGVFLLLVVLSPKAGERPLLFTCQRCGARFSSPPIHPLPERYQEDDLSLCEDCGAELEETIRDAVRRELAGFLTRPR
jgi:DNA-directed RNA polymerase subunit RPC12/RpoP